nr:creatininase family protein [Streptomyces sp. XY152]
MPGLTEAEHSLPRLRKGSWPCPRIAGTRLNASELRELAQRDAVVLLPVGSNELHGEHLPTGVDDFLAVEVCREAAVVPMAVTPSVRCGSAEHHMPFGGTVTLSLPTLHSLPRDVCRSILCSADLIVARIRY